MEYLYQTLKKTFYSIKFKYTSTKEIKKKTYYISESPNLNGYNKISTKILKASSQFIISPFTYICNQSLSSGIFPSRLKYSVVKPLFKKRNQRRHVKLQTCIIITILFKDILKANMCKNISTSC